MKNVVQNIYDEIIDLHYTDKEKWLYNHPIHSFTFFFFNLLMFSPLLRKMLIFLAAIPSEEIRENKRKHIDLTLFDRLHTSTGIGRKTFTL